MICESCHQNLATVHLTEIVQKQKKELHLCEECARGKSDVVKGNFTVHDFLSGLADAAKKKAASPKEGEKPKAKPEKTRPAAEVGPCPACGLTFPEFKASGRLGCHADYEHFKKELLPLLEKIHGATQHTGRVPSRVGERLETQKVLTALRKDLNLAIQREEYERAATLRDKIKTIETEAGQV
jgi:protein arginine kinase activator